MSEFNLMDHSCVLTSLHILDIGVGAFVKANFVDEQKNRKELVEIFCVRTVGGLTELMLVR